MIYVISFHKSCAQKNKPRKSLRGMNYYQLQTLNWLSSSLPTVRSAPDFHRIQSSLISGLVGFHNRSRNSLPRRSTWSTKCQLRRRVTSPRRWIHYIRFFRIVNEFLCVHPSCPFNYVYGGDQRDALEAKNFVSECRLYTTRHGIE